LKRLAHSLVRGVGGSGVSFAFVGSPAQRTDDGVAVEVVVLVLVVLVVGVASKSSSDRGMNGSILFVSLSHV
jgi:hypothetical protein